MNERWLPVVGYEGLYEVSNLGRVRSLPRVTSDGRRIAGLVRKTRPSHGRVMVIVSKRGERKTFAVSHLVLRAFVGARQDGLECCHNDGNFQNNALVNLRWDTPASNWHDRDVVHNTLPRGSRSPNAKMTEADVVRASELRRSGVTLTAIADLFGVSTPTVCRIFNRRGWRHVAIDTTDEPHLKKLVARRRASRRQRTALGTFA